MAVNTVLPLPPQGQPVIDPKTGIMAPQWWNFFNAMSTTLRAGKATYGPAAVATLTVVNGVVTAVA